MLLGNPLRLVAEQPEKAQAGAAAQPYRVLVTGIPRVLGETCYVRARAWAGTAGSAMSAGTGSPVELAVPLVGARDLTQQLLMPGTGFVCHAQPYLPEPAQNPYEYDARAALARDGVAARLRVETMKLAAPVQTCIGRREETGSSAAAAPVSAGPAQQGAVPARLWQRVLCVPARLAAVCRLALEKLFDGHLSPAGSALARALMLGDRGRLDEKQIRAFERSGSLHLMAVSGLHVGFLAGVISYACTAGKVGGRVRGAAVAAGTGLFALVTGMGPAVLRAAVMLYAGLWHPAGRRGNPLNSLGLAALLILAANPLQIADAGFQLSFAATLGIIAWSERRAACPVADKMRATLLSSYGAQVSSLPVQFHHFYRFAPWAPLNNVLLLPLGGLAISVLFAVSCAGLACPAVFAVLAWPVDALLRLVAAAAATLSRLPFSLIVTGQPSPAATLAAFAAVVQMGLALGPGSPLRAPARFRPLPAPAAAATTAPGGAAAAAAITAAVALILLYLQAGWLHRPGPGLTASFFSVGQGDAALIRCGSQAVLVDFGPPAPPGGTGPSRFARCVLPYLHATRTYPLLGVVSHPHADHVGGLEDAMRRFPRMRVLTRDCFMSATAAWLSPDDRDVAARLVPLDREGLLVLPVAAGTGSLLVLELFWAPGLGSGAHMNELSCALRVSRREAGGAAARQDVPAGAVLFAGDLGHEAEQALVQGRSGLLAGAVLKVGHHGSGGSTAEWFLRAVSPILAVISVGRNGFGHPSPDCLHRLAAAGVAVLRTDTAGWVHVRVTGGAIVARTFR